MLKKITAYGAAIVLAGGLSFAAVQSASATAPPAKVKALGVCIKSATGTWRVMEPRKLHRSQYGKCRAGERKILVPTVDGVPKVIVPSVTPTPTPPVPTPTPSVTPAA